MKMFYGFNLVIEVLLISRVSINGLKARSTRFNLVIEVLLISSRNISTRRVLPDRRFNLVIEVLLISSRRRLGLAPCRSYAGFNLVIEVLLISSVKRIRHQRQFVKNVSIS